MQRIFKSCVLVVIMCIFFTNYVFGANKIENVQHEIKVEDVSISFDEMGGIISLKKDGREESYPFLFGKNKLIELMEKSSSPALSSASYNSDGTLSIWVQFIGECLGGLTIEIGIKEKRISMRMRLVGELMFEGYSGVLTGTLR